MEIIEDYPPNYAQIKTLNPPKDAIFCYGNTIYIPNKIADLPADIEYHEYIHSHQQKKYTDPSMWWTKYILDIEFRLDQELEAYSHQYAFVKSKLPGKIVKALLFEFADNLCSMYNIGISHAVAESKIRNRAKKVSLGNI